MRRNSTTNPLFILAGAGWHCGVDADTFLELSRRVSETESDWQETEN